MCVCSCFNWGYGLCFWLLNYYCLLDDTTSTYTQLTSTPASTHTDDASSITPPEAWGGDRLSDKFSHHRHSINLPSRFSTLTSTSSSSGLMLSGLQDSVPLNQSTSSLTSSLSLTGLRVRETLGHEGSTVGGSSPLGTKIMSAQTNLENLGSALSIPRRFSSYAERIGAAPSLNDTSTFPVGSPKPKKTGAETREELLNSFLSRSELPSASGAGALAAINGGMTHLPKTPLQPDSQQGNSFTLQLFQRTLEETLASFQKSIHDDMRNLHLEILRQFHLQEMEMSNAMGMLMENQAEIVKELQSLRKETQQLRQLL